MGQFKTYIAILFILICSAAIIQYTAIKYGFAPYGMRKSLFGYDSIVSYKTDGRFVKTAKVSAEGKAFDIYMIGSSRLRDGLDPETVEALTGMETFNYGLSGLLAREMEKIVGHLVKQKQPKLIIIGLDFFAFNDATTPSDSMVLETHMPFETALKLYLSKFSIEIVQKARKHKKENIQVFCSTNGFCEDKRFTPEEVGHYIKQGLGNMGQPGSVLDKFNGYKKSYTAFERMLEKLSSTNTKVIFFHSPAHYEYYAKLEEIGLLETYTNWKNDINKAALENGYQVWDFNIASPATTLAFDQSERYFNDDLHYTKYFGDIILETILGSEKVAEYSEYSRKIEIGN